MLPRMSRLSPKSSIRRVAVLAMLLAASLQVVVSLTAGAQSTSVPAVGGVDGSLQPPVPGVGHDYIHLLSETVNPANGQLSIRIQLPVPKGRGITPPAVIEYNSAELSSVIESGGSIVWPTSTANGAGEASGWGNTRPAPLAITSSAWNYTVPAQGSNPAVTCDFVSGYSLTDLDGTGHTLAIGAASIAGGGDGSGGYNPCPTSVQNTGLSDGQVGSQLTGTAQEIVNGAPGGGIGVIDVYGNNFGSATSGAMEDRNGNYLTLTSLAGGTDTAARPMTLQLPPRQTTWPYNVQAGTYSAYGLQYSVAIATQTLDYTPGSAVTPVTYANCGTPGGTLPANSATITIISSITLPNNQTYQFKYDPKYGTINEIDFPGGGKVVYQWNLSPNYQQVSSLPGPVTPPGGTTTFSSDACTVQWQVPVVTSRTVEFDGATAAQTQTFSYGTIWDSNNPTVWTVKNNSVSTLDGKTGRSFNTTYQYFPMNDPLAGSVPFHTATFPATPMEQTVQHFDWGNAQTPLDTVTEGWYNQLQKACEVHTLNNNQSYGHFYIWQYGFIADDKTYDLGQVSNLASYCTGSTFTLPGATPARETVTTFQQFTSPVSPNLIFGRPQKVAVYAYGSEIAETDYAYDQFSPLQAVSNLTNHDEANFPSTVVAGRGNLTTVTRKCFNNGCSRDSVTTYHYDEAGQILSMADACGNGSCSDMTGSSHTTNYSYSDHYSSGAPPSGEVTDAYLTQITYPPTATAHTESFTWNYGLGEVTSSTDENGQTTAYLYNDSLGRLTETDGPADPNNNNQHPMTQICYNDAPPNPTITTSELLNTTAATNTSCYGNSGTWKNSVAEMDGMFHTIQTQLISDPQGTDYVDTAFDGEGRVYSRSNPHRSSSSPTDGTTTFYYDAMGKPTVVINPDNSYTLNCYNGIPSTMPSSPSGIADVCNSLLGSANTGTWVDSTNEVGNTWQRDSDSFGNLTQVMEPAPGGGWWMETDYSYDGLNNLLAVSQHGDDSGNRNRAFSYDSLSQLTSATNAENGTVSYKYDVNGNVTSRTDARGVAVNYQYDALNRVIARTYASDAARTPWSCYQYDNSSVSGAGGNLIGRLTNEWTVAAGTSCPTAPTSGFLTLRSLLAYDTMGRVTNEQQCTPANCAGTTSYALAYGYDLSGDAVSLISPPPTGAVAPFTLTTSYDSADRLQTVASSPWNSTANHPACLFAAQTSASSTCAQTFSTPYAPFGGLMNASYANGLTLSRTYDARLRVAGESDTGGQVLNATPGAATITIVGGEQTH